MTGPNAPSPTTAPRKASSSGPPRAHQVPGRGDELERADRAREVAVLLSRPVRGRAAGARDPDVRQRREVVERESLLVQVRTELAVAHARADRHGASRGVERHDLAQLAERQEAVRAVGDRVEAVARAQHLELRLLPHELPHVVERASGVELGGSVLEVARPVRKPFALRPGRERREGRPADETGDELEERALGHGETLAERDAEILPARWPRAGTIRVFVRTTAPPPP